jgi:DNA-binding CsgD family transcriptional regulator/PAS domain-containing protein
LGQPFEEEALLDRIYEAAVDPAVWPELLRTFAEMMGGSVATLRWVDAYTGAGVGTTWRLPTEAARPYLDYFVHHNPVRTPPEVMRRRMADWKPRVALSEAWIPREDLVRTEYYNDWARRFGLEWDLSIALDAEDDKVGFINVFRTERHGPHDPDHLRLALAAQPHFIRAFRMGRRLLGVQGLVADLAEAIQDSVHGVLLLETGGRVRYANPAAERHLAAGDGLAVIGGRLTCAATESAKRLQALVGAASAADPRIRTGGSMALTTPTRRRPLSITVAPMRSDRSWLLQASPAVIVSVTDMDAGVPVSEVRLRDLFGLSAAEIRVAVALFEGLDLRQAAARLGVTYSTVRSHLQHVFEKTGASSQADLARLMNRIADGATR